MNTVIWDWNGTLLDDAWVGFSAMNVILSRYGRPPLRDMAAYRAAFCFPVQEYYENIGMGADMFPVVSHEWMAEYMRLDPQCVLRDGALEALQSIARAGCRQVILSASQRDNLLDQMARYPIGHYFEEVVGLTHIYATSKEGVGQAWLRRTGRDGADCVMIGDTLHDFDVARALGCRCVLVTGGHQGEDTLRRAGCPVALSLDEAQATALSLLPPAEASLT